LIRGKVEKKMAISLKLRDKKTILMILFTILFHFITIILEYKPIITTRFLKLER